MAICPGVTKKNTPCRAYCVKGKNYCWAHQSMETQTCVEVPASQPVLEVPVPGFTLEQLELIRQFEALRTISASVPELASIIVAEKPKRKLNISVKGMEAKVEAGKKLAVLNSIRKEFIENAKLNGEW